MENKKLKSVTQDRAFSEQIWNVFFDGMNQRYAGNAKSVAGHIHGSKTIQYDKYPWNLIDTWVTSSAGLGSGGQSVISYLSVPVWMMHYFGGYHEQALPCLKAALKEAYSKRLFYGGRGTETFTLDGITYSNSPAHDRGFQSSFKLFRGEEYITDTNGKSLGFHWYHGGKLF